MIFTCEKCDYKQRVSEERLPICPRDNSPLIIEKLTLEEKYEVLVARMRDFATGMYPHEHDWVHASAIFVMERVSEPLEYPQSLATTARIQDEV